MASFKQNNNIKKPVANTNQINSRLNDRKKLALNNLNNNPVVLNNDTVDFNRPSNNNSVNSFDQQQPQQQQQSNNNSQLNVNGSISKNPSIGNNSSYNLNSDIYNNYSANPGLVNLTKPNNNNNSNSISNNITNAITKLNNLSNTNNNYNNRFLNTDDFLASDYLIRSNVDGYNDYKPNDLSLYDFNENLSKLSSLNRIAEQNVLNYKPTPLTQLPLKCNTINNNINSETSDDFKTLLLSSTYLSRPPLDSSLDLLATVSPTTTAAMFPPPYPTISTTTNHTYNLKPLLRNQVNTFI